MVDDAEKSTTSTEDPGSGAQFDEYGRRQEPQENGNADISQLIRQREASRNIRVQEFASENPDFKEWSDDFIDAWDRYFHTRFKKKDISILNAIFSVESFDEYVGVLKKRIESKPDSDKKTKETIYKEISETIEKEIVIKISELYIDVDKRAPDKTFEEIIQENFMESINLNLEVINTRLTNLGRSLSNLSKSGKLPENIKEMLFYKNVSLTETRKVEGKTQQGLESTSYTTRPYPLAVREKTTSADFIQYVSSQSEHYMNLRRYLHNATVIFKRGKGEHGFYAGLAEYAKQLSTSDMDSFMILPDSNLFMAAHNLYIKHLTMFYAKHSWIHQPDTFSTDFFEINTDVEKKVIEDLRILFPYITNEEDWRLQRALKIGVGISRAVTLSEVEIAAYADPAIKAGRTPKDVTYESFYISDSSALTAFRPTYNAERFMPPDLTRGPLFFMPVSGFTKDKHWDHNVLWKRMSEFQQSYIDGKGFTGRNKDELLLIDAMQNFGKVGALDYRSSWRLHRGYESWLIERGKKGEWNYIESWKQIENIGYVVLKNFMDYYLLHEEDGKAFLKGGNQTAERDAFFKFLNDKYINYNPVTGDIRRSLNDEIADIKVKNPEITDSDLYKLLLNKALFGVLRNRVPTLFIRLDRNRMTQDGVRAYEEIRRNVHSGSIWEDERMDETLRNLSNIEMKLRLKVSDQMKQYLTNHDKELADPNIKYVLTEEFIRENLKEILPDGKNKDQQIQDAVDLYKYINKKYLVDTDFSNEKIKMLNDGTYPYTLALEEYDRSFVAYRGAGDAPLYRALNDTAQIEQKVSEAVTTYVGELKDVSLDHNHDLSPLIKRLLDMKTQLSILHGDVEAWKKMEYLIGFTINYFRKDSVGKAFYGALGVGRRNSIASEFAGGTSRGVWEWDNPEIDRFIIECERQRIIPRDQNELKEPPKIIPVKNKFLNFLGIKERYEHKVDKKIMTGQKARELFGATKGEIIKGYLWKYLPLILAVMIWASMAKAFKKEITGKDQ